MAQIRLVMRLVGFGLISSCAALEFLFLGSWRSPLSKIKFQAHWLHRYAKGVNAIMGIHLAQKGDFGNSSLITSNHVGYVDIFTIAAAHPVIFVAKDEIKSWPWAGMLTRCGGTIFIKRMQRSDIVRVSDEIKKVVEAGLPVALFLEGTTGDGTGVLPFSSALLEPAIQNSWSALPCHVSYKGSKTGTDQDIAWPDEEPFFTHLLRFLKVPQTVATLSIGQPLQSQSRKELAQQLHQSVVDLSRAA